MEDDIANSFVDFNRYDGGQAGSRLRRVRLALGACTLLGTGMALGLLVERCRIAPAVSL